ncbi:MAG: hypothetical protein M1820_001625 [Bogoriella megaspora]|nr:MAG: hypothetical protein M1820_001625 [Bogoriella megaspora]
MSGIGISIQTRVILDPNANNGQVQEQPINSTQQGYQNSISKAIRTLSNGDGGSSDIEGFLYVPDLSNGSEPDAASCQNQSRSATNVDITPNGGIPDSYSLIAIAPWLDANCVLAYMNQAKADKAGAFIFYLPNDQSQNEPQPANDGVWRLGDGGQWKSMNPYPVYAVPGYNGHAIVKALAEYSGKNISDVPSGGNICTMYNNQSIVGLYADVDMGSAPNLPSLWNFVLIVVAVFVFAVGVVSLLMHIIQRRRRANLRDRIANGEVDLTTLGIFKRLVVPREMLDKLPLETYGGGGKASAGLDHSLDPPRTFITELNTTKDGAPKSSLEISTLPRRNSDPVGSSASKATLPTLPPSQLTSNPNHTTTSLSAAAANTPIPDSPISPIDPPAPPPLTNTSRFSQPTCAICLDDFIPHESTLRVLPCSHIFHPECIDDFLLNTSPLCPMCKTSVLPKGYCPTKITNAMVRYERRIQIIRQARTERLRRQEAAFAAGLVPRRQLTEDAEIGSESGAQAPTVITVPGTSRTRGHWRRERVASPISVPDRARRFFSTSRLGGRRVVSAPTPSSLEENRAGDAVEREQEAIPLETIPDTAPSSSQPRPPQAAQDTEERVRGRREWARQRALALMGHRGSVADVVAEAGNGTEAEAGEEGRRGGNRVGRAFRAVFPGFR